MKTSVYSTNTTRSADFVFLTEPSVFVTECQRVLQNLHISSLVLDPRKTWKKREVLQVIESASALVWVDVPLFSLQKQKSSIMQQWIEILPKNTAMPFFCVTFDIDHMRVHEKEKEGVDPLWASQEVFTMLKLAFPKSIHLAYQHVMYPFEGGVSLLHRFIAERLAAGDTRQMTGECTPLWYQDAVLHCVQQFCMPYPTNGRWTGNTPLTIADFERSIRSYRHFPSTTSPQFQFPFSFPNATPLATRSAHEICEEIAVALPAISHEVPSPSQPTQNLEKKSVLIKPSKKLNQPKKKKRLVKRVVKMVGMVLVASIVAYAVLTGVFLSQLFALKSDVAKLPEILTTLEKDSLLPIHKRVVFIDTVATTVPIPYSLAGYDMRSEDLHRALTGIEQFIKGTLQSSAAQESLYTRLQQSFRPHKHTTETIRFADLADKFKESSETLSSAQLRFAETEDIFTNVFGVGEITEAIPSKLASLRKKLYIQQTLTTQLSSILDGEGRRSLAVVLLDPEIQRSLGGVPTVAALLTFEQGKLLSTAYYDVKELDSLLGGSVDAPEEFATVVGEDGWQLSDGLLSLDGEAAARQLLWFLHKQTKEDIHGVLTISSYGLHQFSLDSSSSDPSVLGIQTAPEQKLQSFVEELLSPNDTSDFVSTYANVAGLFERSLASLYLRDTRLAPELAALGWDGRVIDPSCPSSFANVSSCRVEYGYVWEFNRDASESSTRVERKLDHSVRLTPNQMQHLRTFSLSADAHNTATYRPLIKFALPVDAFVEQVFIGEQILEEKEYVKSEEFGKLVVTLSTEIPAGQTVAVKIQFVTPTLPTSDSSLVFFEQKQTGTLGYPYHLNIEFAPQFHPKTISPQGTVQKKGLSFETTLEQSRITAIGF